MLLSYGRQKGFMIHHGRRKKGNRRVGMVIGGLLVWGGSGYCGLVDVNLIHHGHRHTDWRCDGDQAVDIEQRNGASQRCSAEEKLGLLTP